MTLPSYRTSVAGGSSSGTSNRTATITPAVGDLFIVFCNVAANTQSSPTCADNNGGSYDLITCLSFDDGGGTPVNHRLSCFARTTALANTTSTVVTVTTGSNTAGAVHVIAIQNMHKYGSSAILQFATQANQAASSTPAPAFSSSANTNNVTIGCVGNCATAASMTNPTGWTERQDAGFSNDGCGMESVTRDSGFTGTTVTWGSTSATKYSSIILELDRTYPLTAAQGSFSETGQEITPAVGMSASQGSFTETGQAITPKVSMPASATLFSISGNYQQFPNDFNLWSLLGITVDSNTGTTPPTSSNAADVIKSNTTVSTGGGKLLQGYNFGPIPADNYYTGLLAKGTGSRWLALELYDAVDNTAFDQVAWFDLTNGVVGGQYDANYGWGHSDCTITANGGSTPASGPTSAAELIVETGAIGVFPFVYQYYFLVSDGALTFSLYMKASSQSWGVLQLAYNVGLADNYGIAWFNLGAGSLGSTSDSGSAPACSSAITSIGSGWYRCSITISSVPSGLIRVIAGATTGDLSLGYTGTNGNTAIEVDGAQLVSNTSPGTYTASTSSRTSSNLLLRSEEINSDNGSVTVTPSIESLGSSWYRLIMYCPSVDATTTANVRLFVVDNNYSLDCTTLAVGTSEFEVTDSFVLAASVAVSALKVGLPVSYGSFTYTGESATLTYAPGNPDHPIVAGMGTFALTGEPITLATSLPVGQGSFTESGQSVIFNTSLPLTFGSFTESGQATTLAVSLPVSLGSFAETGQDIIPKVSLPAAQGSFTESGQTAGLTKTSIIVSDEGSFSESGQSVIFNVSLPSSFGSFSETGQNANLLADRKVLGDTGSFVENGQDAGLLKQSLLNLLNGSFVLSGQNVVLNTSLPSAFGSFSLSGQNNILIKTSRISLDFGSFVLSGQNANLLFNKYIQALQGSYSLSGRDTILRVTLPCSFGSFVLSGQSVNFLYGRNFVVDYGSFVLNGQNVTFFVPNRLTTDYGNYTLTGENVSLPISFPVSNSSFSFTGENAVLTLVHKILADYTSYVLTGENAGLVKFTPPLAADTGTFAETGYDTILTKFTPPLLAEEGSFSLSSSDINFDTSISSSNGGFNLTGYNTELLSSRLLILNGTSFTLTANNAHLSNIRKILGSLGVFIFSGEPADLISFRFFKLKKGFFLVTVRANLDWNPIEGYKLIVGKRTITNISTLSILDQNILLSLVNNFSSPSLVEIIDPKKMKQYDTSPPFRAQLFEKREDGKTVPVDLTGYSVDFSASFHNKRITGTCAIEDAEKGIIRYDWVTGDTTIPGKYRVTIKAYKSIENIYRTFPGEGYLTLVIDKAL